MSSFLVHKCVCHDINFVDIKKYIIENNIKSIKALQVANICSTKCKMCKPYLELLLQTGEVEFDLGTYLNRT